MLEDSRALLQNNPLEKNVWTSCIEVHLAEAHMMLGHFQTARVLLQMSFEFFQSNGMQAHSARVLYRQSVYYKHVGNQVMHHAFLVTAKKALRDVPGSSWGKCHTFKSKDFDSGIQPWFR
jgi:hypothetical protein